MSDTHTTFDVDDLDRLVPDADRLLLAETILAWADLDTGISRLILLVFGLQHDAGSILIGNMDLKTKVERIKAFYTHIRHKRGADQLGKLLTSMQKASDCRNVIAHRKLVGRLISKPTRLVFLSARHVKGGQGRFEMLAIDHSEFVASARFARRAAEKVHEMIIVYEDSAYDR